jgi:hypothetical protein
MRLACAPAGHWPLFASASPLLMKALAGAPLCEVWSEYRKGSAQLWLALDGDEIKAACVTLSQADRTLDFWLCSGSGCDWRALGDEIAESARGHFNRLTITGRRGWARVLGFVRGDDGEYERRL